MPRHTRKPGSKQQRKRAVPKVRRYRVPKLPRFADNPMLKEAKAETAAYINTLRGRAGSSSKGRDGKNHSTERTGPHRASGEKDLGSTGDSERKRVPLAGIASGLSHHF